MERTSHWASKIIMNFKKESIFQTERNIDDILKVNEIISYAFANEV